MRYANSTLTFFAAAILLIAAPPVFSQGPTQAQRDAIRSACRADYQAHCASVPPGGAASLQCLQTNMSSLSSACQTAVHAVGPAAEAKPESRPESKPETSPEAKPESAPAAAAAGQATETAAPPAKTAAAAPAGKPTDAQISAIRRACRSDYPRVCAGVPTGGAAALQCLEKNKAKVASGCGKALAAAGGGGATAAAAPATTGAAPAASALVLRPMRPREELFLVRSACGGDVRALCAGVAPGGGRIAQCLGANAASLSPACRQVLAPFAAR